MRDLRKDQLCRTDNKIIFGFIHVKSDELKEFRNGNASVIDTKEYIKTISIGPVIVFRKNYKLEFGDSKGLSHKDGIGFSTNK